MFKKLVCLGIVAVICLSAFGGCGASHIIPKGKYAPTNFDGTFSLNNESTIDCFWLIKGNIAEHHVSGMRVYKCDIILEGDKVFFVGYVWTDIFSSIEQGKDFKYEVIYNEEMKNITILK